MPETRSASAAAEQPSRTEQNYLELAEASKEKFEELQAEIDGHKETARLLRYSLMESFTMARSLRQKCADYDLADDTSLVSIIEYFYACCKRAVDELVLGDDSVDQTYTEVTFA